MIQKADVPTALFRTRGQAAVLRVLRFADGGLSLTDLAGRTGLALSQVHTEVERLERAGITKSERIGRTRIVSLDDRSPVASDVAGLIDKLLGIEALIADALSSIHGVGEAFIFGSWAARRSGVPGEDPADIDLLIVGSVDADEVFDALRAVEDIVGRPINVVLRSREEWDDEESGFSRSVRSGPRLTIQLSRADGCH